MEPLISVIVPAYNVEKYIEECLDTIIKQSYTNIEVIVIDDGSKDETKDKIMKFCNIDDRVRYIYTENGGVSKARNLGLDMMNGKYVTFVDADDIIDRNLIRFFYDKIIKDDSQISTCWCNYLIDNKIIPSNIFNHAEGLGDAHEGYRKFIEEYTTGETSMGLGCCSKMFVSSIIKECKLKFEENTSFCEDIFFVTEYLQKIERASLVRSCLYTGRDRPGRATSIYQPQKLECLQKSCDIFEKLLVSNGLLNMRNKSVLDARRLKYYISSLLSISQIENGLTFHDKVKLLKSNVKENQLNKLAGIVSKDNLRQKRYYISANILKTNNSNLITGFFICFSIADYLTYLINRRID